MLNLNEEYTYYKDKQLLNYCLGCFRHSQDHEGFGDMQCYHSDKWGMKRFTIDYGSEIERRNLCKLITRHIRDDEGAYLMFRCDFDFCKLAEEEEAAERDFSEIRALFEAYCKANETEGFIFTHFSQKSEENPELLLTKHVHIVYREVLSGQTFSEFVHFHVSM